MRDPYFYIVNDIDEFIEEVRAKAPQFGWVIYAPQEDWAPKTEPDFFPKMEEIIIRAAKKAMERNCSDGCPICYKNHPMLQIEEHTFIKLCPIELKKKRKNKAKNERAKSHS